VGVGSLVFSGLETRDAVAKVGRSKIASKPFYATVRQALEGLRSRNPNMDITREVETGMQDDVLRELIIRELFVLEAKHWDMKVAPQEVAGDLWRRPAVWKDGKFDPQVYYQFVIRTLGLLPKEFERERAKDLMAWKFRELISAAFIPPEAALRWAYQVEHSTRTEKDWQKERAAFAERVVMEKQLALLNQFLQQLSQKNPVKPYLRENR
jgi:hypothetical protein